MSVGIKRPHAKEAVGSDAKPKKFKPLDSKSQKFANGKKSFAKGSPTAAEKKPFGIRPAGNKPVKKDPTGKKPPVKNTPFDKAPTGDTSAGNPTAEKTDWNKLKKEKKELKLKRKQTKAFYDVSVEVKQIYEKLKCRTTENKKDLVKQLYDILKKTNSVTKLVMAHDTARIIQCLLKHASPEIRAEISEELIPMVVDMSMSKYAHFCVLRMIKYGSHAIREKVIGALLGSIVKLTTHTVSSGIIDVIYVTWASNKQKAFMRQEFYGDMYKKSKDNSVKKLSDTYKSAPTMKSAILGALKLNLIHAANKKLVDNCLIHCVLLEYLEESSEESRDEMITTFSPMIPSLITTREGCKAGILCFWHSATKERRAIVKSLKEHMEKICTHEHGHILILAIVNAMDDTKAIKKSIFDHIFTQLDTIVETQWGRKVIEWFVQPADKECFHPQLISILEEGLQYGKKDKLIRRKEILEQIQEQLAQKIAEKPDFWLKSGHLGLTTGIILKNLDENSFNVAGPALASVICQSDWMVNLKDDDDNKTKKDGTAELDTKTKKKIQIFTKGEEAAEAEIEKILGIEHSGLHIALKKIMKNDKERTAGNLKSFGSFVVNELSPDTLKVWIGLNRACFILLNIYENCEDTTVQDSLRTQLAKHVTLLKNQKHAGAKLLIEKLKLK